MEPGGTARERLDRIVNFWKSKYRRWRPLSRSVTYFKAVLRLYNVQHLSKNAEIALNRLLRVEITVSRDERTKFYSAHCIGPNGFFVKGKRNVSPKVARSSAAYLALSSALGPNFPEYKEICHPKNYEGISAETLQNEMCEAFPWWKTMIKSLPHVDKSGEHVYPTPAGHEIPGNLERQASGANKIQGRVSEPVEEQVPVPKETEEVTPSQSTPAVVSDSELSNSMCTRDQQKVSVELSSDILYWDPIKWKPLSKKEREDNLFQFWVSTSQDQWPKTFNLFGERNLTTTNCFQAVTLLFLGEQKRIDWLTLDEETGTVQVRCKWRDSEGKWTEPVTGSGCEAGEAKNDAAKQSLRIILGPNNFKILEHVSRPFFIEGPEDKKVDVAGLRRRLLDAKAARNSSDGTLLPEVANCSNTATPSKTANENIPAAVRNRDHLPPTSTEHRRSLAKSISGKFIDSTSSSSAKSRTAEMPSSNDSASKLSESIQKSSSSMAKGAPLEKRVCAAPATKATELALKTAAVTSATPSGNESQAEFTNSMKSADITSVSTNAEVQDSTGDTPASVVTSAVEPLSSSSESRPAKNNSCAEIEVASKSVQPSTQSRQSSDPTSAQNPPTQQSITSSVEPAPISAAAVVDNVVRCDAAIPVSLVTSGEAETENPLSSSTDSVSTGENSPSVVSEMVTTASAGPNDSVSAPAESDAEKDLSIAQQSVLLSATSSEDTVLVFNELPAEHSAISEGINLVPPLISPDAGAPEPAENTRDPVYVQAPHTGPQRQNEHKAMQVLGDPFAEYFSTCEDGSIKVPPWLTKYLDDIKTIDLEKEEQHWNSSECRQSPESISKTDTPFLPFDNIIGYEYPQESTLALDLLFEGRQEPQPQYDTTKYVLCEVVVGSQVFLGLGPTEEEARENAAKEAIRALEGMCNLSPDQTGDRNS